jgi:hypothetical protein
MTEKVTCIVKGESHKYSDCRCITEIQVDGWQRYTSAEAHEKVKASPGSIVVEGGGRTAALIPAERDGHEIRPNPTGRHHLRQPSASDSVLGLCVCYVSGDI